MTAETEQGDNEPKGTQQEDATPSSSTNEAPTTTTEEAAEEPPKDEEGLLLEYDVILCGTGLVQSILASALTRTGKTVLHCDGNDHYGELDTVWTFDYLKELFDKKEEEESEEQQQEEEDTNMLILDPRGSNQNLQFHSMGTKTDFPITQIGTKVKTSYGEGTVTGKTIPTSEKEGNLEISLDKWTMADGTSPTVYIGVTLEQLNGTGTEQAMEEYFKASNEIQSVRALEAQRILQQQSRSLAIDVTPCLLYASGVGVNGMITSNVAEHLEFQTMQGMYWLAAGSCKLERVPCSKGDVMQSSLLPGLDKRRFMKFFQSAMDYATERELLLAQQEAQEAEKDNTEEGVLSLNERQLNQGRSLARPQNKAMAKKDLQVLYDCMEQNMDFDQYLADHAKLSPQLRQLIRHALALDTTTTTSGDENTQLGLSTHEGMGRLCDHLKALGRFGTTAFLTPLYGSGELPQFFCRSAAVYGATYLLRRVPQNVTFCQEKVKGVTMGATDGGFGPPAPQKHIQASHVVVAQDARAATICQRRLLRRVSLLRGNLIPGETRAVLIVPPSSDKHNAIHGVVLDETTKVAPYGCSVLHLTTVVDNKEGVDTLDRAVQALLQSAPQVDEIFHATFSYGLHEDDSNANATSTPEGLHVIQRNAMPLVVDEAFLQAKSIFATICGSEAEFLAISEEMEARLKEQLQGAYRGPNQSEDDTEQVQLDSAMEMIEEKTKATEKTKEELDSAVEMIEETTASEAKEEQ